MVKCKLSIITPVYNGHRFIESCIQNVIEQKCPQAEHVIVDGGSLDGTVEIIKRYADHYSHIRWVSEKDRGQSDAMNKGVAMAVGDILGFLNVDDYYEPNVLEEICTRFQTLPKPTLLVGNCNVWNIDGTLWFVSSPHEISLRSLFLGRFIEAFPMNSSAYFYHKCLHDKIRPYVIDEHYGMDVHFIYEALQAARVVYVDRLWGNFRYLEGTKTYEDDLCGGNRLRVERITEYYLKQQPLIFRSNIQIIWFFFRIIGIIGRVFK